MRTLGFCSLAAFFLIFLAACNFTDTNTYQDATYNPQPQSEDIPPETGDDDTWIDDDDDQGPHLPALPKWLRERPYLQNRSLWGQEIDMADPPPVRDLGCMGVGNGKVFGILGNQYPLASWHNLGGPTYQKDLKWFTDKEPWLIVRGHYLSPATQTISRVRTAPIVIASAANQALEWTSVNFAPIYGADTAAEQALISVWIVRNLSRQAISEIYLEIDSNLGKFRESAFLENDYSGRWLSIRPLDAAAEPGDAFNDLWIDVGELQPGEERAIVVPYVFTQTNQNSGEVFQAIQTAGVDALLESTLAWWNEWAGQIATIETPDPKFNELMFTLALSIKVNQATTGALSQMSQYSNTWLRDTHGPSLLYPLIGLNDDFKAMLDYLWGAAVITGNLANAVTVDLDTSDLPAEPDWRNLGTLGGRIRAESPSALVLEHENYLKATGDLDTLEERYDYLWHAVMHQELIDNCLQPFSSDETFEDVMEATFGENIFNEPDDSTLSFYSSLLLMRAAGFMERLATLLGKDEDAADFADLVERVRVCAENTFWMPDLGIYAVKADTATREPYPRPYEDISTMPIWLDALPLTNPRVVSNFETVMDELGHRDGALYSRISPIYNLLFPQVKVGIQTGMSHGYWLNNLDKMFHPTADQAFELWKDVPTAAGFTDEAVVVPEYGHLSIFREPFGIVCDTSARFRSWEAGILGQAFLYHLTGYDYDYYDGTAALAPQLPPKWDTMAFRQLAYNEGRFDLTVTRTENDGRRIVLTTDAATDFTLTLTVPLDAEFAGVRINGASASATAEVNKYGRTVVRVAPFEVPADGETAIEVLAGASR